MKRGLEERQDLLTGEKFIPKKVSQKFSCPANRIKYNNLRASEFKKELSYINNPLISNYRILEELMEGKAEAEFHTEFMKGRRYDFNVMTYMSKYEDKGNFPCLYKYMILKVGADKIKIIRYDKHPGT